MNPGVYGDIQHIWDEYHNKTKLNLVVNGSVNRLMNKIFFDDSQPLYGRNTGTLMLKPFAPSLLIQISVAQYMPQLSPFSPVASPPVAVSVAP